MESVVNHKTLIGQAWGIIRPYILETPSLLLEEKEMLDNTQFIYEVLTQPKHLFSYMGLHDNISRTITFKDLPEKQKLREMMDVANTMECFFMLFSTQNKQLKKEYKLTLEESFYDFRPVGFYHATTFDLPFKSFNELLAYFDGLCKKQSLNVVMSKNMLEIFSLLLPTVISRFYNTPSILLPSYAGKGFLPMYAAVEKTSGTMHLVQSVAINRCFANILQNEFFENETPVLIDSWIGKMTDSFRNIFQYFSTDSILNNNFIGVREFKPCANIFSLTKEFSVSRLNANAQIFSYNQTLQDFILVVSQEDKPGYYIYISEGFTKKATLPSNVEISWRFALSEEMEVRALNEEQENIVERVVASIPS